jgi:hypothetical protein
MNSICSIAPTVCRLLGVASPASCEAEALDEVTGPVARSGTGTIERCLIFSPDAIGTALVRKHASLFLPARRYAPIEVCLRSVMPPKTPVCYASMFTGARPVVHGITEYAKRAPGCESLFDVLAREGRSAAIVAVRGSTMDTIFRHTGVDQFTGSYDEAVLDRTVSLIQDDTYEFIVAYQQEYDDTLHREHPESPAAMEAVGRHVKTFLSLAAVVEAVWGGRPYLIAFSPDHGAHYDPATGTGAHGKDVPEDMEVSHFFDLSPGARPE